MDLNLSAILRRVLLSSFERYFAALVVSLTVRAKGSFDLSQIYEFAALPFLLGSIKKPTNLFRL
jgi:hypothetical protein